MKANDVNDIEKVRTFLLSKRFIDRKRIIEEYLAAEVKGKKVLDVGVCEHSVEQIENDYWQHKHIVENARYCLGIDNDAALVKYVKRKGYNVLVCDATSKVDLGERFDVVLLGSIIEHVDNPVNLLKFAKRHLKKNGKIIVGTANPMSWRWFQRTIDQETIVCNLEHVSWLSPSNIFELSRRAGLSYNRSVWCCVFRDGQVLRNLFRSMVPVELLSAHYFVELGLND